MTIFFSLCLTASLALGVQGASLDSKAGAVTTAATGLNVRKNPSPSAAVEAVLKKGSYITLLERSGAWWKVEYAHGKYGYCHADYITVVQGTPVTVATQSASLNIRKGSGTAYPRVGAAERGQVVIRLTESNGWTRILYEGTKTGYVSSRYLSGYYEAVSLKVPDWKQTDPRWAEKTIGNSGKSFSQIGCATTAIAMMESFRLGKTIYPDEMETKLTYTPSGSVYWPSHFQAATKEENFLAEVYQKLKQGKPVLLGAFNAQGGQHWVVVTGYTGAVSLAASAFTIRDPGSRERTNLRQFLSAYPTFYKYFSY